MPTFNFQQRLSGGQTRVRRSPGIAGALVLLLAIPLLMMSFVLLAIVAVLGGAAWLLRRFWLPSSQKWVHAQMRKRTEAAFRAASPDAAAHPDRQSAKSHSSTPRKNGVKDSEIVEAEFREE